MKFLGEISDGSLGLGEREQLGGQYKLRKSARAIVLNERGEMAVQHLQTYSYHKLPGGGIDSGESVEEAVKREVLEEIGCKCEIIKPIGLTIEYRNRFSLIHISYCFSAKVVGSIGTPKLEAGEIEEGQATLWMKPEEALAKMEKDIPTKYPGEHILEREKAFLKEYLNAQKE